MNDSAETNLWENVQRQKLYFQNSSTYAWSFMIEPWDRTSKALQISDDYRSFTNLQYLQNTNIKLHNFYVPRQHIAEYKCLSFSLINSFHTGNHIFNWIDNMKIKFLKYKQQ